jgi:N-acetylmuramoyl-L-alanine amidase
MFSVLAALLLPLLSSGGQRLDDTPATKPRPAFILCIDPGHPSENNSGKGLSNGLREVTVCWQVALLLKKEVEREGIKVVMTKSAELEYVTNQQRAAIANKAGADMMVRLHADAGGGSGFAVYYPRRTGTVRGTRGPEAEVLRGSADVAKAFFAAFSRELDGVLRNNGLKGDENTLIGSRQGALTGSIFSTVPTVLIEMVFLTNKKDADWIRKEENRLTMARAIAKGVLAVRSSRAKR